MISTLVRDMAGTSFTTKKVKKSLLNALRTLGVRQAERPTWGVGLSKPIMVSPESEHHVPWQLFSRISRLAREGFGSTRSYRGITGLNRPDPRNYAHAMKSKYNQEGLMKLRVSLAVIPFCLVVWTLPARAEGTTCGNPTIVVPDGRLTRSSIPTGATFFYAWYSTPGLSYSAEVESTVAGFNVAIASMSIYNEAGADCTVPLPTRDTALIEPQVGSGGFRKSWIAVGGIHWMKIENTSGVAIDYTFSVADTSMFSPRWSTFSGFHTSWGINNTTSATCNVAFNVRNTANVAVGGSPVTFPVAAGALVLRDTNASDLNVPTNQAGKVTLTHDCPPGAIQADAFMVNDTVMPPVVVPVKFDAPREGR